MDLDVCFDTDFNGARHKSKTFAGFNKWTEGYKSDLVLNLSRDLPEQEWTA